MRLGSNDPVEPPVAPTTRGGFSGVIVGLMAILLIFATIGFLFLGSRGGGVPPAPKTSFTPRPSVAVTAAPTAVSTATPTATPSGVPPVPAGSCLVTTQNACDSAVFDEYQPTHAASYRAALLRAQAGSPVYTPVDGTVTAVEAASYLDDQGQPVSVPGAQIKITAADDAVYVIIFRHTGDLAVGQGVRAGQLLGLLEGDGFALSSKPADIVVSVMTAGAGGLDEVNPERMRTLFPGF